MKIKRDKLKKIVQEEFESVIKEGTFRARDLVPPEFRGKLKDTFTKIPSTGRDKFSAHRKANEQEKAAWEKAGGQLSTFDRKAIAQFLEDAGLDISVEHYMDNIKYARGSRPETKGLGDRIYSVNDAVALALLQGRRRGHLRPELTRSKKRTKPTYTYESIEQIVKEETEQVLREGFFLDLLDFVLADKPAREARQKRKQIVATWNDEELQKWTDEEWPKIQKQIKGRAPHDQRKIIAKAMDEFGIEHTYAGFHDPMNVLSTSRQKRREDEKDQAAAQRRSYQQGLQGDKEFASRDPGKTKEYNRMYRKATRRIELGQGTPRDEDLVALGPIDDQVQFEQIIREELEAVLNEKVFNAPAGAKDMSRPFNRYGQRPGAATPERCASLQADLERIEAKFDKLDPYAAYDTTGYPDPELEYLNDIYMNLVQRKDFQKCEAGGLVIKARDKQKQAAAEKDKAAAAAKAAAIKGNPTGRTTAVKGGRTLEEDLY